MPHASKGHVLIVDDDASIKRMFQLLLKDAGYRVSTAGSGQEVLQFLRVLTPDVILLDISMPGMDGVELTRQIKSDPRYPFIPIILITALGDMKTKIAGLDAGADDFLVKPVEFAELLARLRVMVRLQQSRRSLYDTKRRIETLLRVSQTLTSSLDAHALLSRLIHQLVNSLGAIRGSIVLISDDQALSFASATEDSPQVSAIQDVLRDGVAGWVIRARRSLLINDARQDARWNSLGRTTDNTRSVVAVPILNDYEILGAITLVHSSVGYFQDPHVELIEIIAAQSALALGHARLFGITALQKTQLERRSFILEEMLNVGERLRLNVPIAALLDEIAEAIHRSLSFGAVVIQLAESPEQGCAGTWAPRVSARVNADSLETEVVPHLRPRFQVSRSFFVPQNAELGFDGLIPLPSDTTKGSWEPGDLLFVPIGPVHALKGVLAVDAPLDGLVPDLVTVQALELFADQVATAVQNSRLFAKEQHRANQLQLLHELGRNFTELMTPDQLLRLVASVVHHTFELAVLAIALREGDELVVRATAQSVDCSLKPGAVLPHSPALDMLYEQARTQRWAAPNGQPTLPWGVADLGSELLLPIILRNQVTGVLAVAAHEPSDAQTEWLLQALVAQLAIGLQNAQLFVREQEQVQQLNQVNALSVKLTSALALEPILGELLHTVATIFACQATQLYVVDREASRALLYTQTGEARAVDAVLAPGSGAALFLPNGDPPPELVELAKIIELPATPVVAWLPTSARVSGALILNAGQRARTWSSSERNLLQTVANLLAQSLENSTLYVDVTTEQRTLSAVLSSAADPIIVVGPQRELLLFNPAAREILALDEAAIRAPITHELLQQILAAAPDYAAEYALPDGRILQPSIARLVDADGGEAGLVLVLQDISALKLLEQQRMERLREHMSRYLAPQLVAQLVDEGGFGDISERDVVVLFADLRGFTAISERLPPRLVVEQILNRFFTVMTEVLYAHAATIDKFLGDGIMAVFGTPLARPDDVPRAIKAAVAMQYAFNDLQLAWRSELGVEIGLGIGMSFGRAVVGNLGSPQRLDYTLIGDVVNTASRLVDLAEAGQIIAAAPLVAQLADQSPFAPLPPVRLKGKHEPLAIFAITG